MDFFEVDVARSKCLQPMSSRCIANMFYHKISHFAISYSLSGKINVMLEFYIYM